ncbi:hypothetical protein ACFLIM_47815 [Nonomuraea sp. M3C6]|uniref:Uncharacterized protein n=1 Tax=Nonomuraea marmarensis TaxID=3351344 RepID=A0ABW7AXD5_9ACTN
MKPRDVVVVDVDVRPDDVEACDAMMHIDQISVKLRSPLGGRVVLDSSSGLPSLPGTDVHLAQVYWRWDPRQS